MKKMLFYISRLSLRKISVQGNERQTCLLDRCDHLQMMDTRRYMKDII